MFWSSDVAVYLTCSLANFASCFHQLNIVYCISIQLPSKKGSFNVPAHSFSEIFKSRNLILLKCHQNQVEYFPARTSQSRIKTNFDRRGVIQAWSGHCCIVPWNNSRSSFCGEIIQWPVQAWSNIVKYRYVQQPINFKIILRVT